MQGNFVKNFFDLPVIVLVLLLFYALGSRQVAPSAANNLVTLSSPSSSTPTVKSCRVTAPRLNVRANPHGQIVRILKRDESVINNGQEGAWIKTDSGYVYGQYVSC